MSRWSLRFVARDRNAFCWNISCSELSNGSYGVRPGVSAMPAGVEETVEDRICSRPPRLMVKGRNRGDDVACANYARCVLQSASARTRRAPSPDGGRRHGSWGSRRAMRIAKVRISQDSRMRRR